MKITFLSNWSLDNLPEEVTYDYLYHIGKYDLIDHDTGEIIAHLEDVRNNELRTVLAPERILCEQCSIFHKVEDTVEVTLSNGETTRLCKKCADRHTIACSICGKRYYRNCMVCASDTGNWFCREHARTLARCPICHNHYEHPENLIYMEDYKMSICTNCNIDDFNCIDSYHTMKDNGRYSFFTDAPRKEKLCMGFELEVSNDNEDEDSRVKYANHVYGMFPDFFHFEEDCSIGEGGFEMISQPATMDHLLAMENKFKEAFKYLTRNGYTSHNGGMCGFHIHVDRTFFGNQEDSCVAKIIFLMMKHKSNFIRFSRRNTDQMLDWCNMFEDSEVGDIPLLVKYSCDGSRYMALNLTNSNTLEFRLWRGTLRYETFIATLKFTNRICNLVKDKTVMELNSMSWEDILGEDEDIQAYWATRNPSSSSNS